MFPFSPQQLLLQLFVIQRCYFAKIRDPGTERVTLERGILILIINFVFRTLTAPAADKMQDPSRDPDSAREQLEHEKQKLKEVQDKQSYWRVFPKMLTCCPLHVKSYFNFVSVSNFIIFIFLVKYAAWVSGSVGTLVECQELGHSHYSRDLSQGLFMKTR